MAAASPQYPVLTGKWNHPAGKWTSPELTGNLKVIQDTKKWWGRT